MRWPTRIKDECASQGAGSPSGTDTSMSLRCPSQPTVVLIFLLFGMTTSPGRGQGRLEHVGIGATAAQIAGHRRLDVLERGPLVVSQERRARHDHAGRAEAALQRVVV